ncbi:uncharacterized protein C10orf143 homolog isoform X2 [Rousettus aegyptiacus]|uniref:uncharacterized protein C10orf143 homolog isoform X2 n=1 Tax=Rousettus aegyptiacus TaxID=9407 RepID=UPI00168D7103|nr:uncharacterized protein C10orf143 homolog isoform X2 [Rousettus aegyptiacus]
METLALGRWRRRRPEELQVLGDAKRARRSPDATAQDSGRPQVTARRSPGPEAQPGGRLPAGRPDVSQGPRSQGPRSAGAPLSGGSGARACRRCAAGESALRERSLQMMRRTNQNPFSRNAICSAVRGRRSGTEVGTCGKYRDILTTSRVVRRCELVEEDFNFGFEPPFDGECPSHDGRGRPPVPSSGCRASKSTCAQCTPRPERWFTLPTTLPRTGRPPGRRDRPLQGRRGPARAEVRCWSRPLVVFRAPDRWRWVWLPGASLLGDTPSLSRALPQRQQLCVVEGAWPASCLKYASPGRSPPFDLFLIKM